MILRKNVSPIADHTFLVVYKDLIITKYKLLNYAVLNMTEKISDDVIDLH